MIRTTLFVLGCLIFLTAPAQAQQHGYAIHYIHGEGSVDGIKLAYQYHPELDLPQAWRHFDVHFESSINFWRYGEENHHDGNFVLAVSPVIRYPFATYQNHPIAVEFGIGLALLDDTQFAGKNVSTHYQFEDRIGLVYQMDGANIAIRYMHYSNAGFKSPNPGLDFLSLSYSAYF
ncbi:acyloxyacyl hydrolase [Pseudoalteromonas sp. R3]|uniref:acyloxyacyl hydrolase n=1 Tax=Pseudoalteromonas sp. R3 TaxID=1709477 RepID=UPI0006B44E2E|nr:acyloxyacyl hydrolase [Pseudoalteromonas sp. R3]AZZ98606.1 acyloxyacyl hydrolase [Pseudoalteromonas sp. R3]